MSTPVAATPATTPVPAATPAAPQAPATTSQPAAAAEPEKKFVVKVDGEERTYTESEARRLLSKAGFADKVVSQAKEALKASKKLQEEREAERELAKKNRREFLKKYEIDEEQLAREVVERKLAEHNLSPEQRRALELESQLSEKDARLQEIEKEKQEAENKRRQVSLQRQMESSLAEAAEAAGIPKDADAFYAVYETVRDWVEAGLPWDAQRIVEQAKERIDSVPKRIQEAVLKGTKGKALVDMLGKDVVAEVLRYKIEERRGGGAQSAQSTPAQAPQKKDEGDKYISPQEAQELRLERLRRLAVKK